MDGDLAYVLEQPSQARVVLHKPHFHFLDEQRHFTRIFKSFVGMTPAAWRRTIKT
jgi:hypothetical protein